MTAHLVKRAKKVSDDKFYQPLYDINDVSRATGLSAFTIRSLVKRKHVELAASPPAGQGVRALYALRDVLSFYAAAALLRLGIKPRYLSTNIIQTHLMLHIDAVGQGNCAGHDLGQYSLITISNESQFSSALYRTPVPPKEDGSLSWITIDSLALALKIISDI